MIHNIFSVATIALGAYMIFGFYNGNVLTPPVLSGLAIILLTVRGCITKG